MSGQAAPTPEAAGAEDTAFEAPPEGRSGALVARLMAAKGPERPVLERSVGGLLMVDSNLAITDANGAILEISGLSRRDLVGSPLSAHFQVPETAAEAIRQAFRSGGAVMFELALRSSRDAPEGSVERRAAPIRCIFAASLR
jgi:PAS domain-containing protein